MFREMVLGELRDEDAVILLLDDVPETVAFVKTISPGGCGERTQVCPWCEDELWQATQYANASTRSRPQARRCTAQICWRAGSYVMTSEASRAVICMSRVRNAGASQGRRNGLREGADEAT